MGRKWYSASKHVLALAGAAVLVAVAPGTGSASQLIDRNARNVRLAVSPNSAALLTYQAGGKNRRVLVWGAVNARPPSPTRPQIAFRVDYSGGASARGRRIARRLRTSCRSYDGPALQWLITACRAPDGSYWAVQSWQRALPHYGLAPTAKQAAYELRLSHWRGQLPSLTIETDWAYGGRFDHLSGSFSYLGKPVHGFRATRFGIPLDTYGRNLYVDTFNSSYGPGWRRENSFLTHRPSGVFCYGFYPHGKRPSGKGQAYRATIVGPGVTPDISWQGPAPGPYEPGRDRERNAEQAQVGSGSTCRVN